VFACASPGSAPAAATPAHANPADDGQPPTSIVSLRPSAASAALVF
jgi:hypothetical protein